MGSRTGIANYVSALLRPMCLQHPDVEFHLALLGAANNELLIPFGIIIEQALQQMFAYTSRHNPRPLNVVPLHMAVLEAVARGAPEAASKAVLELLKDTDAIIAAGAAGATAPRITAQPVKRL